MVGIVPSGREDDLVGRLERAGVRQARSVAPDRPGCRHRAAALASLEGQVGLGLFGRGLGLRLADREVALGGQQLVGLLRLDHRFLRLRPSPRSSCARIVCWRASSCTRLWATRTSPCWRACSAAASASAFSLSCAAFSVFSRLWVMASSSAWASLRQDDVGHDHVGDLQAVVLGQPAQLRVDALAQHVACGADDVVVERPLADAHLRGLPGQAPRRGS